MLSLSFRCLVCCLLSFCNWPREVVAAASISRQVRNRRHHEILVSKVLGNHDRSVEQHDDDDDDSDDGDRKTDASSSNGQLQKMMQQLVDAKLGKSYNKAMRPLPDSSVFDGSHRIKVYLGLKLVKVLEIHQIKQTFVVAVWLRRMWADYRLKYNALEYFGGTSLLSNGSWDSDHMWIPIEQEMVWTPEVQVLNSVAKPEQIWKEEAQPRVNWYDENKLKKSGYNMVLVTPEILTITCTMHLKEFPFDTQHCSIRFGGWTAGERFFELGAVQMKEDANFRDDDAEFDITALRPVRKSLDDEYLGGGQPIPTVEYPLRFTRKPHFYLLAVVLPMFLLVLLGQSLYWMDMHKERLSTGITTVLAVMASAFLIEPLLPKTGEVLWIEKFQTGCYVITCLPLFFSILLDHCVLQKLCTKDQGKTADRVARIVHPMLVICFYFVMFGVPGFRAESYGFTVGHKGVWPYDIPEIMVFSVFNICIFTFFLVSACMELPFVRKALPNGRDAGSKEEQSDV